MSFANCINSRGGDAPMPMIGGIAAQAGALLLGATGSARSRTWA
jgi:hypothetical protein